MLHGLVIQGRWALALLVALVLSLAVNLFVAGLQFGHGLRPGPQPVRRDMGEVLGIVPPAARQAVREALGDRRPELRQRLQALRAARQAAFASLAEPDFDPAAATRALARSRDEMVAAQAFVHGAPVDAASRVPPEARATWVRRPK